MAALQQKAHLWFMDAGPSAGLGTPEDGLLPLLFVNIFLYCSTCTIWSLIPFNPILPKFAFTYRF